MNYSTVVARTAAKPHRCESCGKQILTGDVHLRVTVFPSDTSSYVRTFRKCARCGYAAGQDRALDAKEIPYDQLARDGLL